MPTTINDPTCPPYYFRDEWLRYPKKNVTTGEFIPIPCNSSTISFWIAATTLILARIVLGIVNGTVIYKHHTRQLKYKNKIRIPLAPTFDYIHAFFLIVLIALSPVTSAKNGTSMVLFALTYLPYFASALFFNIKMVHLSRKVLPATISFRIYTDPAQAIFFSTFILGSLGVLMT
jgi:hypothetical protein